jgi:predicted AAA+ superfamily ATPase
MYKRVVDLKQILKRKSVFLLGPRQTGKSTLIKAEFKDAFYVNLLKNKEYQKYLKNPGQLQEEIRYLVENESKHLIVIDEIQRVPLLLNEVHDLIESDKKLRFVLTGSSARKIKRGGANLLGGRASWINFYPLCYPELGKDGFKLWMKRLQIGALPSVLDSPDPFSDLKDYVALYLREEIQAEGLTRSLENFARFLDFAALMNAEQINYTALASDAQLSPSTVRDYFEILSDTLIGHTLPAFMATKKRKAMSTHKFYLFDCGITNALLGRREISPQTPEFGKQLEQAIFLELRTYLDYRRSDKRLEFWRSTSQFEVDFLVYDQHDNIVAIEVKSKVHPTVKDYRGILALDEEHKLKRKIVVCNTDIPRKTPDGTEILPLARFLEDLWRGKIV